MNHHILFLATPVNDTEIQQRKKADMVQLLFDKQKINIQTTDFALVQPFRQINLFSQIPQFANWLLQGLILSIIKASAKGYKNYGIWCDGVSQQFKDQASTRSMHNWLT